MCLDRASLTDRLARRPRRFKAVPAGRERLEGGRSFSCIGLTVLLVIQAQVVWAQTAPGDLDPSFGIGGKVTTDFGPGSNSASAVAIQADGKIVAVGHSGSGRFALARYNVDGSLDLSFGTDGRVTTSFGAGDRAFAVAIQSDGKIVGAGSTDLAGLCCQFALARYNNDGSLDTTFNGNGKVTTSLGELNEAFAVAIQPDGKIVAAGVKFIPFVGAFALARYNADGSLDQGFGTSGKVTTDFGGRSDAAYGVVVQPDGKIVAAGAGGPGDDFALARFNADGSLDPGFGVGGKVTTDFGRSDHAATVALQTDGKILAAGGGGFSGFALARYNADGSLDVGFGTGGKVTTQFFGQNAESALGVVIQANSKIVTAGFAFGNSARHFALARYNTNGSLDPRFGTGGKVTTAFGDDGNDGAASVALQADGKIVAAGGAGPCTAPCEFALAPPPREFALARYFGDPSGTPPAITPNVTGTIGLNDWYISDVLVSWTVTSVLPIRSQMGCNPTSVTTDTPGIRFTCTATSDAGTASRSVTIKRDATPPTLACSANPNVLWPPNHQLVAVETSVVVNDTLSGRDGFVLNATAANEGDPTLDVVGWRSTSGFLRAERLGAGTGRMYVLTYLGRDNAGNETTCNVTVTVLHDRRSR